MSTTESETRRPGTATAAVAAFFDRFAGEEPRWRRRNQTYHRLVEAICRFHVSCNARVLEIGSGSGDLLAALEPSRGVGVDASPGMVELARSRHPELDFVVSAGERLELGETFDYVVLSDLAGYADDLLEVFERVGAHSHRDTRVVIGSYSQVWRPAIRLAEALRLKAPKPIRNWVAPSDVVNLLRLAGFEIVTTERRVLMPKQIPLLTPFLNGFLGSIWPFSWLDLTWWVVARPQPAPLEELSVTVVCPCRNEAGNVRSIIERLPQMGTATELIFVEGGSTDDTREEIERQIATHPELDVSLIAQTGKGKGDAVRAGFAAAKHDVLMILDGDVSVLPEDLSKFYRALVTGRAEFVNGSRLVYDLEPGAMRFLNLLGNKAFSIVLEHVLGQAVKDTLCGTKVLRRRNYERIAASRDYFGEFDPFGDFDLLLGAGKLGLTILDMPVRYHPRTYGETNISRWRDGTLLLRMAIFAFWKFRVAIYRRR
jgi:SAM-dependent methyltransferase